MATTSFSLWIIRQWEFFCMLWGLILMVSFVVREEIKRLGKRTAPGCVYKGTSGRNNVHVGRTRLQTVTHVNRWNRKVSLSHLFAFFLLASLPPTLILAAILWTALFFPHSTLHTIMIWNWEQSKSFLSYWFRSYNRDKRADTLRNNSSWKFFVGKKKLQSGFSYFSWRI